MISIPLQKFLQAHASVILNSNNEEIVRCSNHPTARYSKYHVEETNKTNIFDRTKFGCLDVEQITVQHVKPSMLKMGVKIRKYLSCRLIYELKHATCGNYVEKTGGCNHITCCCGTHFCFFCPDGRSEVYTDEHQVYDHISEAHEEESLNDFQ